MKNIFLLCSFIFCLFIGNIHGQYDADAKRYGKTLEERSEMAVDAVKAIKEGVLIFRLSSEAKKIEEIDKLLDNPELEDTRRERLETLRQNTIEDAEEMNRGLCEAFENDFDFSEVLFVFDTSIYNLKAGKQSGYFVNKDLEIDPGISLENRSYRVARFGWPFNKGSAYKNIYVMDENYNDLERPFPNGVRTGEWLISLIRGGTLGDPWKYFVRNAEKKIKRFYYRAVERGFIDD